MCYAHTAGLPWTCGLKSVCMYLLSDGVTQQVHMISGVLVEMNQVLQPKIMKKDVQIYRNSSQNLLLGPPWDICWSHIGASWEVSWTHAPKRLDFISFGTSPGSPRRPIWRPRQPTWRPRQPTWRPRRPTWRPRRPTWRPRGALDRPGECLGTPWDDPRGSGYDFG